MGDAILLSSIIFFSVVMLALAVVIMTGRGDNLIAGYNTLKPQERERYYIKRLRGVIAVTLVLTTAIIDIPIFFGWDDVMCHIASAAYILVICVIAVILANTWCKKKKNQ